MNSLWFDKDLKNATDTPRIHHQLAPNKVFAEKAVLQVRTSVFMSASLSVCPSQFTADRSDHLSSLVAYKNKLFGR